MIKKEGGVTGENSSLRDVEGLTPYLM